MAYILRYLNEMVGTLIKNPLENHPKDIDVNILLQLGLQGLIPQGKNNNANHIIVYKDFGNLPLKVL